MGRRKLGTERFVVNLFPEQIEWIERQSEAARKDRSAWLREKLEELIGDEPSLPPQSSGVDGTGRREDGKDQ